MLWSVMPENVILAGLEGDISLCDGCVGDCAVSLRRQGDGSMTIERLCSTNPADYLRSELAPGQRILSVQNRGF